MCTGSEFQALVRVHSSKFKLNRLSLYRPDLVVICKVAHIQRCIHIPRLRIILKSYRFTSDIDFPPFRQLSCKNQPGPVHSICSTPVARPKIFGMDFKNAWRTRVRSYQYLACQRIITEVLGLLD